MADGVPREGRRGQDSLSASQHYRKRLGRFWAPSWKPLARPCRDLPTPVAISPLQGSESVRSLRESQQQVAAGKEELEGQLLSGLEPFHLAIRLAGFLFIHSAETF